MLIGSESMSILLGPDSTAGAAPASGGMGGGREGLMSPAEKRRMSNPALGGQPGVIEVEVQQAAGGVVGELEGGQDGMQRDFVRLCDGACSVICCRMSPSQKGRMVRAACVMCCTLRVARRTSHVTRHTSHVTRHTSHVTGDVDEACASQRVHAGHWGRGK